LNLRPSGYEPDELPLLHRASIGLRSLPTQPGRSSTACLGLADATPWPSAWHPWLVAQKPIVVYSTDYCGYCTRAKNLLRHRGWAFEEINVEGDREKRAWLVQVSGMRTVPQIFIGGVSVGGYDDIAALDRAGKLAPMVLGGDEGAEDEARGHDVSAGADDRGGRAAR
jgi:glutaredoxin 3